jgi:hypothetical protein
VGGLFAQLYELQESTLAEIDFPMVARTEGKRVFVTRYGAGLKAHFGERLDGAALDVMIDEMVGWPLGILARVTATEKTFAH